MPPGVDFIVDDVRSPQLHFFVHLISPGVHLSVGQVSTMWIVISLGRTVSPKEPHQLSLRATHINENVCDHG
jgi:hypothetical protein